MFSTAKTQFQTIKVPVCNQMPKSRKTCCKVQAQQQEVERRQALLSGIATAITLGQLSNAPSFAKYGDAANVFGRITNKTGYVPYVGEGYSILIPSRWNPSREREFSNIDVRYEDNYDGENNFLVIKEKTDKSSIEDFGNTDQFLKNLGFLFGKTTFKGETQAEGGFKPNQVAAASLLNQEQVKDKNGKSYYKYEFLVRTADGNEGGSHILVAATVNKGTRYILRVHSGDKRWMRGSKKEVVACFDSFQVA